VGSWKERVIPNVVAKFLALLRIQEVTGSVSARRLVIVTEEFRDFSQSLQANVGIVP
jgi:hypothetical protein